MGRGSRTEGMMDGQTYRYIDRNSVSQSDGQIESQSDRQTVIHSVIQPVTQTNLQTDGRKEKRVR